ncbi:MAG: preprotein translocase subunit SecE [Gemmatimonadaceae bacterium]
MGTQAAPTQRSGVEKVGAFFRAIPSFFRAVRDEMTKVTWPDRRQTVDATWRIIIFVLFIGAVIGLLDFVLQLILVKGLPSLFAGR